jgi:glycosyltransferase involved in cell wall biosynthesis
VSARAPIVVLATSFPRRSGDHAGRFVLDLSRGLAELGHSVHHVVPGGADLVDIELLADSLSVERVRFAPLRLGEGLVYGDGIGANLRRRPWRAAALPFLWRALAAAAERAAGARPGCVLLSHWILPCGFIAARLARRRALAHVAVEHGGSVQALARLPGGGRMLRTLAGGTRHLACVSEDLRRKTAALWPAGSLPIATSVQPMGTDLGRFRATPPRRRAPWTLVVLAVGRLVRLKGFDLLIDAARGLAGVTVAIAGDGPERERLIVAAAAAPVRFLGHLEPAELARAFADADVLCAPSRLGPGGRSEGAPVVVAEAFAAGRPVVAARTGGLAEGVREGESGLVVAAESAGELRAALVRLRDDHALLDHLTAGACAAAAAFDYRRVAAHFSQVIEGVSRRPS